MKDKKIILYDSPEAAQYVTNIEGWVSADSHFYGKGEMGERLARQDGCTHKKCECGELFKKEWAYTCCQKCLKKKSYENYLKRPYKEWDGVAFVIEWDGDKYFWSLDELEDYMYDEEMDEIELLICDPVLYDTIDSETVAGDAHEDYEPPAELEKKIKEFNEFIKTLAPHSWTPGKIRTSHKLLIRDSGDAVSDTTKNNQGGDAGKQIKGGN